MFLGLSNRSSDKLPVSVSGYTPIAQFREHTSIRFQINSDLPQGLIKECRRSNNNEDWVWDL